MQFQFILYSIPAGFYLIWKRSDFRVIITGIDDTSYTFNTSQYIFCLCWGIYHIDHLYEHFSRFYVQTQRAPQSQMMFFTFET